MIIKNTVTGINQPLIIEIKEGIKVKTWRKNDGSISHISDIKSSFKLPVNFTKGSYEISFDLVGTSTSCALNIIVDDNVSKTFNSSETYTEYITIDNDIDIIEFVGTGLFTINNLKVRKYTVVTNNLNFNDSLYFKNKSFTLSYSFKIKNWVSFHSYLPDYYLFNNDNLYSVSLTKNNEIEYEDWGYVTDVPIHEDYGLVTDTATIFDDYGGLKINNNYDVYRHNVKGNYSTFYNKEYPYIIELVLKNIDGSNKIWNDINFYVNVLEYNNIENQYTYLNNYFFDTIILYNNFQSSGELNLLVDNTDDVFNLEEDCSTITVKNKENIWNINDIRNNIVIFNEPIFTEKWDSINSYYPIDKIINNNIININSDWNEKDRFRSDYLCVRLKSTDVDKQVMIKYLLSDITESKR